MQVEVDEQKCCGAGTCALTAPAVFDQREEDGVVVLLDRTPAEHLHEVVREAAEMCPARAISVAEGE